jgi:hypothetical protein
MQHASIGALCNKFALSPRMTFPPDFPLAMLMAILPRVGRWMRDTFVAGEA